jgi:hypothetical protein
MPPPIVARQVQEACSKRKSQGLLEHFATAGASYYGANELAPLRKNLGGAEGRWDLRPPLRSPLRSHLLSSQDRAVIRETSEGIFGLRHPLRSGRLLRTFIQAQASATPSQRRQQEGAHTSCFQPSQCSLRSCLKTYRGFLEHI